VLRVIRLCSVFEVPASAVAGPAARFDPVGGMQNHTRCLTGELDRRGVRQDVVTTRRPGAPRRERLGRHATIHRLGLPVATARQLYAPFAAVELARLCGDAHLLHAHLGEDLAVVPLALGAARRAQIPLVLTVHMSLAHTLDCPGPRARLLRAVGGRLEAHGVRRADAAITLTRRLAAVLEAHGTPRDHVHVIPSGVRPAEFAAGRRPDPLAELARPRVVFVGRLAPQKGVETLLEAAARLPRIALGIVGDGPQREALERQATALGLASRVTFTGFRPHDDVPAVLAGADVLVVPSRYEELGTVLLEGMQAGVPIVASDVGGIAEAIGPAGLLVPPGRPDALARAIDDIAHDPALAERLRTAGRERARRYDWSVLAARVHGVYESVVGHVRPPVPMPTPVRVTTATV
jgi:glycogen synthase